MTSLRVVFLISIIICIALVSPVIAGTTPTTPAALLHMNYTTSLYRFEDDAGTVWSPQGTTPPSLDTSTYLLGNASGSFSHGIISTGLNSNWQFGSGNFSITFKIKRGNTGRAQILGYGDGASIPTTSYYCEFADTNKVDCELYSAAGYSLLSQSTITDTNWHEIEFGRGFPGNTNGYLMIDGVLNATVTLGAASLNSPANNISIGYLLASYPFVGNLDELVVMKGTTLHYGNYTPATTEWNVASSPPDTSTISLLPNPQSGTYGNKTNVTLNINNFTAAKAIIANVTFNKTSVNVTNVFLNTTAIPAGTLISEISPSEGWVMVNASNVSGVTASSTSPLVDIQFDVLDSSNITVPLNYASSPKYISNSSVLSDVVYTVPGALSLSGFPPTTTITANFSISNVSGIQPLLTHFTDTSTTSEATIDTWHWDFGDGNTSTDQNPDHTYEVSGTHSVNLTITNSSLSLVSTKIQTVIVYKNPNCDFSSFNIQGNAPFTTYLYDTSTNLNDGPYTYYWDLGDGNTSTSQYLYYTWNITGTYDVKHSVTDNVTTAWKNKTGYITVGTGITAPVASFYGGPQLGAPPLTVFFTDVSTNTPTSWFWEFGDGSNSTSQNPAKWYNQSGFYTVSLTATNTAGSNKTSQTNFVMVY